MAPIVSLVEDTVSPTLSDNLQAARDVIPSFLKRCNIPYTHLPYDYAFEREVYVECARLGYATEGPQAIPGIFIHNGVAVATTMYAHLPTQSGRMFVCLYSTLLFYAEDVHDKDVSAVRDFIDRFIHRRPQADTVLNNLADFLGRVHEYFDRIRGNIVLSSAFNFMTAILLEHDTQGMEVEFAAKDYPQFSRRMSGTAETYGLCIFPGELPLQSFIQAMPDLEIFINGGNDLMSFYKEELEGDEVNQVSLIARCRRITKAEALRLLEDDVVAAHDNILKILAPHRDALSAFKHFAQGYVASHASLERYKLDELDL